MERFELMLFTTDVALAGQALDADLDAIVIDWEYRDKHRRQMGADTQINCDTPEDLARMRRLAGAHVVVRINQLGQTTAEEIETAVSLGADELLLPMVRSRIEVERVLEMLGGRKPLGILIETTAGVADARALGELPLRRVYVGLNDLAIERKTASIFMALVDGTLERMRPWIRPPFGFGGLTLPDRGHPVPCRLLMGEMARLGATHSFLRRSFLADVAGRDLGAEVGRMREAIAAARRRTQAQVEADRAELSDTLAGVVAA